MFLLLMTILLASVPEAASTPTLRVTPLKSNPGIYFEEVGRVGLFSNEWQVIVYYDLTDFNFELEKLTNCTRDAQNLCNLIESQHNKLPLCDDITHQLFTLTHVLQQNSVLLKENNSRYKRGLFNAIGTVSKTLFGTLDEDDAVQLNQHIDSLKTNQDHLLNLIRNQTLIIDTTVNIFNKTRYTIKEQFLHIDKKIENLISASYRLTTENLKQSITTELETMVSLTTLMMIRYQNVQNLLIDLITDVRHGKPHPSIITPQQMKNVLETIQKEIPNNLALPINKEKNNLLQIYQISNVRTAVYNNKIIFLLKIPLPFKDSYQLMKVYPLPTLYTDHFAYIKPSLEYLVIDFNRDHYYSLNNFDLQNCRTSDLIDYLCRIIHPIFNVHSVNNLCEIDLLKHSNTIPSHCEIQVVPKLDFWIQLSQPNKWLFSVKDPVVVDTVCGNTILAHKLNNTGVLELTPGCYLRTKDLIIQAHNIKELHLNNHYLPSLNLSYSINIEPPKENSVLSNSKVQVIKFHDDKELLRLNAAIKEQKYNEELKNIDHTPHIVHHYTVLYLLVTLLLITITVVTCKKYKKSSKQINPKNNPQIEQDTATDYRLTVQD